jgi:hypothetical protein
MLIGGVMICLASLREWYRLGWFPATEFSSLTFGAGIVCIAVVLFKLLKK